MIITKTPLRVSFLGGGTDYPAYFRKYGSGAVLGTAIDKVIVMSVVRFFSEVHEHNLRLSYSRNELVDHIDQIQHRPFRECLRWCGISKDVEVNCNADLPAFTGLGSSSTFVVGTLQALHAFNGKLVQGLDLAYQAIEMERRVLEENVGCQDQTFAAMGGVNLIEFRAEDDIVVNRIPLAPTRLEALESHLLMLFTRVKRKAEEVIAKQLVRVDENAERLRRLRALVDQGHAVLSGQGPVSAFGELLHRGWIEKRSLEASVSTDSIDEMYRLSREAGALGGKLLGAGGGGFMLLFVPPDKRAAVKKALPGFPEVPIRINCPGSRIIHAD